MKKSEKIPKILRLLFQEAYRFTQLPVLDLQLLLAPVHPLLEKKVIEFDKEWRERLSNGLTLGAKSKRHRPITLACHEPDQWTDKEKDKKETAERKPKYYGRTDITKPLHNQADNGISSARLQKIITHQPHGHEKIKNTFQQPKYIGVHIIYLSLEDCSLKILAIMDSETIITSLLAYERLEHRTIIKEILYFIDELGKINLKRDCVRFTHSNNEHILKIVNTSILSMTNSYQNKIKIEISQEYNFKEYYPATVDITKADFLGRLETALVNFNIGKIRKRTGPFLVLKKLLKHRGKPSNDAETTQVIKKIIKMA